ncbi:MAG: hypothetical protein KJO30_08905 [Boseongicola sp.]|nr:hypothetical protein [Boseongicola sp.]NNJ68738.1 hypothetical protein [Boseongicola sp.]
MAERATEPETGHNEVVDLNNDARWQARLAEARARRAEALKLKGLEDKPKRAPRKPWEDEANTALEAEKHQRALDDKGLDFHDRMNALQKVLKDNAPEPDATPDVAPKMRNWSPEIEGPTVDATPAVSAPSEPFVPEVDKNEPPVDSLFDDPAFQAPEPEDHEDKEPEYVPLVALVDPLPPRQTKQNSRPWLDAVEPEVSAPQVEPEVATVETKAKSGGMPFALGVGLVALVAMPFFHLLPPILRGPEAPAAPVFGLQPAFGITAAMVEFPSPTQSGEFVPQSSVAPSGPLVLSDTSPPEFARAMPSIAAAPEIEVFVMPKVSTTLDVDVTTFGRAALSPLSVTQAMWETQARANVSAGRLPGVLAPVAASSLTPKSRP